MNVQSLNLNRLGILTIIALLFASCNDVTNPTFNDISSSTTSGIASSGAVTISDYQVCGDPASYILWAGQHHQSGSVTVSNNEEYLFVTITTNSGWHLMKSHLHVAESISEIPSNRQGIPVPGQFQYSENHDEVTEYTYALELSGLSRSDLVVAIHAEVVRMDENGLIVQAETAWGGDLEGPGRRWWFYGQYTVQECVPNPEPCTVTQTETAWSSGSRYTEQGNWATFTAYDNSEKIVTLYAGQTIDIGTVTFTPNGSQVTITVNFASDWGLQNVAEAVKIQGYNDAPSGNPSPGQFTTYKGNSHSITVDTFNFYGVHIDAAGSDC